MAPARWPTPRSSRIPLEALECPGGTILRQDSTLFWLPGGLPPLPDYCWTYIRLALYLYTFGLRMCADSTTPSYLAVSGGLEGPALPSPSWGGR